MKPHCYLHEFPTPLGQAIAATRKDTGALIRLSFLGPHSGEEVLHELSKKGYTVEWNAPALGNVQQQLDEYFARTRQAFDVELSAEGTEFQQRVWQELVRIPYGQTISYSQLAQRVGNPKAQRAVGSANGQNPIWLIVPCHRVIGSDGTLTGYAGGVNIKEALLRHENPGFRVLDTPSPRHKAMSEQQLSSQLEFAASRS